MNKLLGMILIGYNNVNFGYSNQYLYFSIYLYKKETIEGWFLFFIYFLYVPLVKTYRDVDVSNSKPTGKARVWVNTASNDTESQDILLPQVDDNNVSEENTWSSKKIDSEIGEVRDDLDLSTLAETIEIEAVDGFVDGKGNLFDNASSNAKLSQFIWLNVGDNIEVRCRGYLDNVAIISGYVDGKRVPLVVCEDNTVKLYKYTADQYIPVRVSFMVSPGYIPTHVKVIRNPFSYMSNRCIMRAANVYNSDVLPDLNDAVPNRIYLISTRDVLNKANNNPGLLVTLAQSPDSIYNVQIFYDFTNMRVYTRCKSGPNWDAWVTPEETSELNDMYDELYKGIATFGIIGDSLSSGCTWNGSEITTNYNLSWGKHLEHASGNKYIWFSKGGLTTRSWLTDNEYGLAKALSPENYCNCYVIALGVNDVYALGKSYLGIKSDINIDNCDANVDSFYGNYAKIIQKITVANPKAKFFLLTNPRSNTSDWANFNTAIREIANMFDNCYLIDMYRMFGDKYTQGFISDSMGPQAHYPASAYAYMSKLIARGIGKTMSEHPKDFLYVQF